MHLKISWCGVKVQKDYIATITIFDITEDLFILSKCQQNCSCLGALDFIEKLDNFIWPLIKVELFQTVKCVSVFVAAWFSLLYRFFNFCSLKKNKTTTTTNHDLFYSFHCLGAWWSTAASSVFIGKGKRESTRWQIKSVSSAKSQFSIPETAFISLLIDIKQTKLKCWHSTLVFWTAGCLCDALHV